MRVSGALVIALAFLAPAASAHAATQDGPSYFWRWTDGSEARVRTFAEHDYAVTSRLPRLLVQTRPASKGRHVTLQTRIGGGWTIEDSGTTDARGIVRLQLNPYCASGAWCRGAFDYRLVVDGRTAVLTVDYAG
jgi:hypothetical protein